MYIKIVVFYALLIGVELDTVSAQRVRWEVADGGNGHWYEVVQGPIESIFGGIQRVINWPDAYLDAQAHGGYLATITSAEENEFVFSLTDLPEYWQGDGIGNYFGPWLGAIQEPGNRDPTAGWQWITTEPFAFTNWHPGEPNDLFGQIDENRIAFFASESSTGLRSGFWNDEQSTRLIVTAYVVESVPEPSNIVIVMLFTCIWQLMGKPLVGPPITCTVQMKGYCHEMHKPATRQFVFFSKSSAHRRSGNPC